MQRLRPSSSVLAPAILALCAALAACGPRDRAGPGAASSGDGPFSRPGTLRFSAIPDTRGSELQERFGRVAAALTETLGVDVEYVPSPDYGASVEAFANGDIQCAWFGGLTGVQARRLVPGSRAIAQGAADPRYYSYFIAHRGTGLAAQPAEAGHDAPFPADALRGRTFTFASPRSTSGRLMPEAFVRRATGLPPGEFFAGDPGFAGSHDNVVAQVQAGAYDVGAVNYRVYDRMAAAGEADDTVVVWRTPRYADYNLTVRGDLDRTFGPGSTARLQEVLVGLEDPTLLAAFDRDDLIPAENADFAAIAEVARSLGFVR